jgi:hypothetical protein
MLRTPVNLLSLCGKHVEPQNKNAQKERFFKTAQSLKQGMRSIKNLS